MCCGERGKISTGSTDVWKNMNLCFFDCGLSAGIFYFDEKEGIGSISTLFLKI